MKQRYGDNFQCMCTFTSVSYGEMIEIKPSYHQVCDSILVDRSWYSTTLIDFSLFEEDGVLSSIIWYFETLWAFCDLANTTITEASRRFFSTSFVNSQVLSREIFELQMKSIVEAFLNRTRYEHLYTVTLVMSILQANQYIAGGLVWNSWLFTWTVPEELADGSDPVRVISFDTGNFGSHQEICYCARHGQCGTGYFSEGGGGDSCSATGDVLAASLTCWYNETCIDEENNHYIEHNITSPFNDTLLDPMLPSRFQPSTAIGTIFNEIMVEQWDYKVSFHDFYEKCHPSACSYTYEEQGNLIFILSSVIAVFGGLNIILRLLCPVLADLYTNLIGAHRFNNVTASDNGEKAFSLHLVRTGLVEFKIRF